MKRLQLATVVAASLVGGFAAGMLTASRKENGKAVSVDPNAGAVSSANVESDKPRAPKLAASEPHFSEAAAVIRAADGTPMNADGLKAVMEKLRGLEPRAYALAMAESDDTRDHAKRLLYRTALEMSATPDQAAAWLRLYKERRGMDGWNETNQDMRSMLTYAGEREGVNAIRSLLKEYPEGFSELDSLVHGVALKHPQAVVDWYNEIPDGSKMRESALVGMMFGIGESGSAVGPKIFAGLSSEDQAVCISGFAEACVRGRGFEGAQELIDIVPEEIRKLAIAKMLPILSEKSPASFVEWAAPLAPGDPHVQAYLEQSAMSFATATPQEAFEWASRNAGETTFTPATLSVVGALIRIQPELAQQWMSENPDHPATPALAAAIPH